MRIDEFSRNELRESHATIQELTSQIQGLQERMNCMNDSREFQDVESICSGKLSHVPSQPAVVPSPRSLFRHKETFLASMSSDRFITDTLSRNSSFHESKCCWWKPKSTGRFVAKGEEQIGSTVPIPSFARMPSTIVLFLPAEVPHNSLAG